jgi:hypothetical protein
LRKAVAVDGTPFAISEPVYAAAGLEPAPQDKVVLPSAGATIAAFLCTSAPALPAPSKLLGEQRAAMQRLWNQ